jgi:ATP-dependent Zn protease
MTQSSEPIDAVSATSRPRRLRKMLGWVLFIGLAIVLFLMLRQTRPSTSEVSLSDFRNLLDADKVKLVIVEQDELQGELNSPTTGGATTRFRVPLTQGMGQSWAFVEWLLEHRGHTEVRCSNEQSLLLQLVLPFVPWLLIFGFVWFFIIRPLRCRPAPVAPMPVVIVNPETR